MKIHHIIFISILTAATHLNAHAQLAPAQNLQDFEFALGELESSYAGFDIYVNDSTKSAYDNLVQSLRSKLSQGTPGWEAALELYFRKHR